MFKICISGNTNKRHRRRKVKNIGGGVQGLEYCGGGGGGGGKGGQGGQFPSRHMTSY